MKKNTIRLTEGQLHQVIKETVHKILKEVELGGESLHGDNPADWYALKRLRNNVADSYGEEDEFHPKFYDNLHKAERNSNNCTDLYDKEYVNMPDSLCDDKLQRWIVRGDDIARDGSTKATRIGKKMGGRLTPRP